jgi:membrane protein required for colicin V production
MTWLDIAIIIILAGFLWYGFFFGLIRLIGNLVGLIIGAYLASRFYLPIFNFISHYLPGHPELFKIIIFILCFSIIAHLVGYLFILLEKLFNVVAIIPFLKTINRLLGAVFGLAEGIFILGIVAYFLNKNLPSITLFSKWLDASSLVPRLINVSKIMAPYLPTLFNHIKSLL